MAGMAAVISLEVCMACSGTGDFFKKKWPEVDDEELLLDKAEDLLRKMGSGLWLSPGNKQKDKPGDKRGDFIGRARTRARSFKLAGAGLMVLGLLFAPAGGFSPWALTDTVVFAAMGVIAFRAGGRISAAVNSYIDMKARLSASGPSSPALIPLSKDDSRGPEQG